MHTPGPWYTTINRRGVLEIISRFMDLKSPHSFYIALVYPPLAHHPQNKEANARLIAAAPDLLAALQAIRERYGTTGECGRIKMAVAIGPELYEQIESAVAKAKSES